MFTLFLTLSLALIGCNAQFFNFNSCSVINRQDCYFYGSSPQCGTNGITYKNRCEFSKAHCADKNLHVLYYRECRPSDFTTTTKAPTAAPGVTTSAPSGSVTTDAPGSTTTLAPLLSGSEAVLDFFCIELAFEKCDNVTDPVCASDGNTYSNPCEFEKTKCTHRDLHIRQYGQC